jgi:hypothetical protein
MHKYLLVLMGVSNNRFNLDHQISILANTT